MAVGLEGERGLGVELHELGDLADRLAIGGDLQLEVDDLTGVLGLGLVGLGRPSRADGRHRGRGGGQSEGGDGAKGEATKQGRKAMHVDGRL